MATVVLADDEPLVRRRLRALLEGAGCEVVGEAGDGPAALALIATLHPEVAVLDAALPGLAYPAAPGRPQSSLTLVVILAVDDADAAVRAALRQGAAAFVHKGTASADLPEAITAILAGWRYLSPLLTQRVLAAYAAPPV